MPGPQSDRQRAATAFAETCLALMRCGLRSLDFFGAGVEAELVGGLVVLEELAVTAPVDDGLEKIADILSRESPGQEVTHVLSRSRLIWFLGQELHQLSEHAESQKAPAKEHPLLLRRRVDDLAPQFGQADQI